MRKLVDLVQPVQGLKGAAVMSKESLAGLWFKIKVPPVRAIDAPWKPPQEDPDGDTRYNPLRPMQHI